MLIAGDTSNKEPGEMSTAELMRAAAILLMLGRGGAIASTPSGVAGLTEVARELEKRAGLLDRAYVAYGGRPAAMMLLREIKAVAS